MNALKDEGGENVRTGEWPKPMGYFQAVSLLPFLPLAGWTRGDMMGGGISASTVRSPVWGTAEWPTQKEPGPLTILRGRVPVPAPTLPQERNTFPSWLSHYYSGSLFRQPSPILRYHLTMYVKRNT